MAKLCGFLEDALRIVRNAWGGEHAAESSVRNDFERRQSRAIESRAPPCLLSPFSSSLA